jgi:hypothetical protein
MKILSFLLFTCMLIFSCNSNDSPENTIGENSKQKANEDSTSIGRPQPAVNGCFLRVLQRDSFSAKLQRNGDRVNGELRFDNFEKDGSSGPVSGVTKDNIIQLIYTFQSEGMTSVMEVYFKTDGDHLIRGIGEMISKGDTMYYKNPDAVKYPEDEKWRKVDCKL